MASIITIILFFVYLWGLGFTATYFVKRKDKGFEGFFVNIAIGLGVFPILAVFLNFLRIPLDWRIFLFLSLAFPLYQLYKKYVSSKKENKSLLNFSSLKLTKANLFLLVVLSIFLLSLFMYAKGAFSYPYLEDEDPWGHTVGMKYVAFEKDAYNPPGLKERNLEQILSYMDPYPPAYDILIGVLHQTSPNLNWTAKFFNALIISLGLLFFYLFASRFMGSRKKAIYATIFLAAIPSYLSHFIWAHALVVTLIFPTLYAFDRIKEDKKWGYIAGILVASIWVTQMVSQPIKITTILLIYVVAYSMISGKFLKYHFAAIFGGMALSFIWWGVIIQKHTLKGLTSAWASTLVAEGGSAAITSTSTIFDKIGSIIKLVTDPGGTASRAYSFGDFFYASSQNMINSPIGIGVVLSLLTLIGLVFVLVKYKSSIVESRNASLCITLFWLVFGFWAVCGATFPISVAKVSFRAWPLLAIPLSLIAVEGLYFLRGLSKSKAFKILVVVLVLGGVFLTSAQQKYDHNTMIWPTSGSFQGDTQGALEYGAWFETIPDNAKVFLLAPRDKVVIGYGKYSCIWCTDIVDFRKNILNEDVKTLHSFLKKHEYEYFVINPAMDYKYLRKKFNGTEQLLPQRYDEIAKSGLFVPVHQIPNKMVAFRVQ